MKLTEEDYHDAARRLNVDVATIKAVAEVESRGEGFLETGEPKILFERHIFHRLTGGLFSKSHPNISHPNAGGYGRESEQHERLKQAVALDRKAALQSASWGKFQVLGLNWEALGYASLREFINAMYRDEAAHLDSFLRYVETNHLDDELRRRDWAKFARGYNGRNYKINRYDVKLAQAYKKYKETE